ncbi:MAG: hypothetical protein JXQ73_18995 [Phycisphaerae bacterium]|nr:hypothetical protein [Phycisphaerae bacterium]
MSLRQWTLCKDGQTFILRWRAGGEGRLLAEIADQIKRGTLPLNKTDLTVMIRMIADSIAPGTSGEDAMKSLAEQALSLQAQRLAH